MREGVGLVLGTFFFRSYSGGALAARSTFLFLRATFCAVAHRSDKITRVLPLTAGDSLAGSPEIETVDSQPSHCLPLDAMGN